MPTLIPNLPGEEVEFAVRRENWSRYEILDGKAVVWVRAVLLKLYKVSPPPGPVLPGGGAPAPVYAAATQTLVTSFFDASMRGPMTRPEVTIADFDRDGTTLEPSTLSEPWNEYVISGPEAQVIQTKAVATRIRILENHRGAMGDPYVQVESQVVVGPTRKARIDELGA